MALHINIEELLSARTVESDRIEYKEGWNPDSIYRSICAFTNDFDNTGGGYILIGVEEDEITKTAKRPIKGLLTAEIANIQLDMIGYNNLMKPYYAPKLSIESVDGKSIIVLWVIAGKERPYEVPDTITAKNKTWKYFIRKYASSIEAKATDKEELISLSNNIPFDDRSNTQAKVSNLSMLLVKDYLINIKSKLAEQVGKQTDLEVLGQMELISGPNEHVFPRNVGLMLFSENPEKYFPLTQVEVVYFPKGDAEEFTEYEPIKGPIASQIKKTLDLLITNFLKEKVSKATDKPESNRYWNYPLQAIEETLVNAFYHRDYQQREPIEIRIYANSILFTNHGGPDRSIQLQAFDSGMVRSRRYRNRRLGEFLKELKLTEGRATGIPTILKTLKENGSPAPRFNTDADRTFFEVELFVHPTFVEKEPFKLDVRQIVWTLDSINQVVDAVIAHTVETDDVEAASVIARDIDKRAKHASFQAHRAIKAIEEESSAIVSDIAKGIDSVIANGDKGILELCNTPKYRTDLFDYLQLANHPKNYKVHIDPLVSLNWLTMTIPNKPTSPKQQYLTTLKGRVILELLKYSKK